MRRLGKRIASALGGLGRAQISISLVVPCYNVGHYIDAFLHSLEEQASGLDALQVILVDDGSTDDTPQRAAAWATRHPGVIEYCRQANSGVSSARNTGLDRARGDWVSFPDPDDLLAPDYLDRVRTHIRAQGAAKTAIVACKVVMLHEQTGMTLDDHVLAYRFRHGVTTQRVADLTFIQLQVATAFYRRRKIAEWGLRFDTGLKPGFEDALFANQYLIRCAPDERVIFAADAVYTYRKRASSDSMQDLAGTRPEFWTSQPLGWLALLEDAERQLGKIPPFVSRVVLYNMKGHLRILLDPSKDAAVPDALRIAFGNALDKVIAHLGEQGIRRGAPAFRHRLQLGLLNRYALGEMPQAIVYVGRWDEAEDSVDIEWFSASPASGLSVVRGDESPQRVPSTVEDVQLLGRPFYSHHRARLGVGSGFSLVDDTGTPVRLRGPGGAGDAPLVTASQLHSWSREVPTAQ